MTYKHWLIALTPLIISIELVIFSFISELMREQSDITVIVWDNIIVSNVACELLANKENNLIH